jgi:hypothetical protein
MMKQRSFFIALGFIVSAFAGFYAGNAFGVVSQLKRSSSAYCSQLQALHKEIAGKDANASGFILHEMQELDSMQRKSLFPEMFRPGVLAASFTWTAEQKRALPANQRYIELAANTAGKTP